MQPDRPASYVDAMFLQKLDPLSRPLHGAVWTTYASVPESSGGVATWHYALSIDVTTKWQVSQADFYPKMEASSGWVARRWHEGHIPRPCVPGRPAVESGCLLTAAIHTEDAMPYILNDRSIMVQNDTHVFDLTQFRPLQKMDGYYLEIQASM